MMTQWVTVASAFVALAALVATVHLRRQAGVPHASQEVREVEIAASYVCGMHEGMIAALVLSGQERKVKNLPAESCLKFRDIARKIEQRFHEETEL